MKQCMKCKQWKPEVEFNKDKGKKDGLFAWCRSCHVENSAKWNKDNPDKSREHKRKWKQAHPLSDEDKKRRYQSSLAWDRAHPEMKNARNQKYRYSHLEKDKERHKDPAKNAIYFSRRKARKLMAGGTFTQAEWKLLKERYGFTCLRCRRHEPEIKLTPDHVLPLSKGGSNDIKNIQPLCLSCNCSKKDKHIDYRRSFRS